MHPELLYLPLHNLGWQSSPEEVIINTVNLQAIRQNSDLVNSEKSK
jgi:hypothetical protein